MPRQVNGGDHDQPDWSQRRQVRTGRASFSLVDMTSALENLHLARMGGGPLLRNRKDKLKGLLELSNWLDLFCLFMPTIVSASNRTNAVSSGREHEVFNTQSIYRDMDYGVRGLVYCDNCTGIRTRARMSERVQSPLATLKHGAVMMLCGVTIWCPS